MFGIHNGDAWLRTTCDTQECFFVSVKEAARYARSRSLPEDTTRISWKSYDKDWYGLRTIDGTIWLKDGSEPLIFATVHEARCHVGSRPELAHYYATRIKLFTVLLCDVPREDVVISPQVAQFATVAVRSADREGERYDLISPIAMKRLAQTCDEGAKKYGDFNWEKGMAVSGLLNHAISHIYTYLAGDRSEDHLAHAVWNCMSAIHSAEKWPHLNSDLRLPNCERPSDDKQICKSS